MSRTSLHEAAFEGNVKMIRYLIYPIKRRRELVEFVNVRDHEGTTPLHQAVFNDHFEAAKLLISAGADVNMADEDGSAPLLHAAYSGSLNCVRLLVRSGADVNTFDKERTTPLQKACFTGNLECMEYLVSKGAVLDFEDDDGATPLHHAAFQGHKDVVKALLILHELSATTSATNSPTGVDRQDNDGLTPLHKAVFSNFPACVDLLLMYGADPNLPDQDGSTPLHFASEKSLVECATLLLDLKRRTPPPWLAGSSGDDIKVYEEALNSSGSDMTYSSDSNERFKVADPNAVDNEGLTALHHASFYGHVEFSKLLISYGASVNARDSLGTSHDSTRVHLQLNRFFINFRLNSSPQCRVQRPPGVH